LMAIVATIAIALTYSLAINVFESRMSAIADRQTTDDLTVEIDNKVRQKYYADISEENIRVGIANGIVDGLGDPNCAYFTAEQWELERDRAEGFDFGIGISVGRTSDGFILVNRVNAGSPAASVLKPGDVIQKIDGVSVITLGYEGALSAINRAPTTVTLSRKRDGKVSSVEITKARYNVVSVDWVMVEKNARISIHSFNAATPGQFDSALSKAQQQGAEGLIIDLRDCTGGSYDAACTILDTILPAGRLMITTDKNGEQKSVTSNTQCITLPICVLISDTTSGAGELFASAISDYMGNKNMKILGTVGTATAGLMTVQEDFPLSDGSALRLTTAKWSTPDGSALEDGVIKPMYEVKLTSYQQEHLQILAPADDPQIQTAADLIKSRLESDKDNQPAVSSSDTTAATTTTTTASTTSATTAAAGN